MDLSLIHEVAGVHLMPKNRSYSHIMIFFFTLQKIICFEHIPDSVVVKLMSRTQENFLATLVKYSLLVLGKQEYLAIIHVLPKESENLSSSKEAHMQE